MFNPFLFSILAFLPAQEQLEFSLGPHYASYLLYQNEEEVKGKWHFGGEISIANLIPYTGIKLRGAMLHYDAPAEQGPYAYEYDPLVFCASFDLLPFLDIRFIEMTAETGIGIYFWRGLYDDEVIVLPTGDEMKETDIGFVGGLTFQIRPIKYLGVEYAARYHYMATTNIYKYGFNDKDDKIWEHGIGMKLIVPVGY
jgi:hypothetical protein